MRLQHLASVIGVVVAGAVYGQVVDPATVERWARGQIEKSAAMTYSPAVLVRWRFEDLCALSTEEVAELRRTVANKPDHPRQRELAVVERQLREGKIVSGGAAALRDTDNWRFCWDMAPGMYVDTCLTRGHAWTLSKDALGIYPVNPGDVPEGPAGRRSHPVDSFNTFAGEVWRLLTGGFGCSRPFSYEFASATTKGTGFEVVLIGRHGSGAKLGSVVLTGEWDEARGTGRIVTRTVNTEGAPAGSSGREVYEGARWDDTAGGFVYASCSQLSPAGRVVRRTVLEELRPLSTEEFRELTAVPTVNGVDSVRGRIEVSSVADLRAGVVESLNGDGEVASSVRLPLADRAPSRGALFWAGVSIVAGAGGLCVYLLFRRGLLSRP